jgi:hypothetical protein
MLVDLARAAVYFPADAEASPARSIGDALVERLNGASALIGRWRLIRADAPLDFAPEVTMEFQHGGKLRYEFAVGARREALMLLYRVEGGTLHTDYPANTHVSATSFHIGPGDVLVFDFVGACAFFVREL